MLYDNMLSPMVNEILEQLSKVLQSSVFRNSEMLQNFLSLIVKETLKENGMELKQYTIAIHAFGRPTDFDANSDPIVRIQASRLRRNLKLYYQDEGKNDKVIISLRKGSYVPAFSISNYQPDETNSLEISGEIHSITVSKLKNLSGNTEMQHILEGFSEELLTELSRYKHLKVIRLKDEEESWQKKGVSRFQLEGSLKFNKDIFVILLSLVDNFSNQIIWSDRYKFELDKIDLIQVQEDVAISVAQQIADLNGIIVGKLSAESNWENTNNFKAYSAFLHFYKYEKNPSDKAAFELLDNMTELVESEPQFGPGWAVLAALYTDAYIFGLDKAYINQALSFGKKAVDLQGKNQSCQTYFGYALLVAGEHKKALVHLEKALSLNPNAIYYVGAIGWGFCLLGQLERGFCLIKKSMAVDFQYPRWFHLGTSLYYLEKRDYDNVLNEVLQIENSDLFWGPLLQMVAYEKLSMWSKVHNKLEELFRLKPDFSARAPEYVKAIIKNEKLSNEILKSFDSISKLANHI